MILLENANIDENTQALVSNKIDFKNAKTEDQKAKILDDCKEALRKLQYGRKTNFPCREVKSKKIQTLCNDLIKDGEEEDEVFENLQAVFAVKKRASSTTPSAPGTKPVYKCNICICSCPRETDCGCACTKHFWYSCPQKDNKGRKGRGGRGSKSFRKKRGKPSKNEENDGDGNTFLTYMRRVSERFTSVYQNASKAPGEISEKVKINRD